MSSHHLVLRWIEYSEPRTVWFLRSIAQDGNYIGEVRFHFHQPRSTDGTSGLIKTAKGTLSTEDTSEMFRLAALLAESPKSAEPGPYRGVIGYRVNATTSVIYNYLDNSSTDCLRQAFLTIVELLRPYLFTLYSGVDQTSP